MTTLFIQAMGLCVKVRVEALSREPGETLDFVACERDLNELMNEISAFIATIKLMELYASADFLAQMKALGATKGMRFKEYRSVRVTLANGEIGFHRTRQPKFSQRCGADGGLMPSLAKPDRVSSVVHDFG